MVATASVTMRPKRIAVINHRTDGAVFAGINLPLNGLLLRFRFKDVFVWEHFAIGAIAVLAPEFDASDIAAMAKHVGKASRREAGGLVAFPATGSHQHSVSCSLAQGRDRSRHENKMRT